MFKMIVCDLDETLLNTDKSISPANITAIQQASDKGVKFVPATGRGYRSLDKILKTLQLYDKENEYTITNNGGILVENKAYTHLSCHFMPYEIAKSIIRFGLQNHLCVQVFTPTMIYAFHINEEQTQWLFTFQADAVLCENDDFSFLETMNIVKVMYDHKNVPYLQSLEKQLDMTIKANATISYSSNRYMEFNSIGVDKGQALTELAQRCHISLSEVIAIGDNHNDLSMLKVAGTAAAVANAQAEVKGICDYVSSYTHNEGAVADIIHHFIS